MGLLRVQVVIPKDGGIPADAVTNTFHFVTPGEATPDHADTAIQNLRHFYENDPGNHSAPIAWMASTVAGNWHFKAYDLAQDEPRTPLRDTTIVMTGLSGAGDSLPDEVAVCCSFAADAPSGAARGRYRGRIYFGPLLKTAASIQGNAVRPQPELQQSLKAGAQALFTESALDFGAGFGWAIHSRADATAHLVTHGWVDDAFDTQRSRGPKAATRVIWG